MKKIAILITFAIIFTQSFGQKNQSSNGDTKSITNFEKNIIIGNKPNNVDAQIKYENDYRVIVWDEPLIKTYKYSNEQFDKLGYEFVQSNDGDDQQGSKVYRNCKKGIVIEVTEWYEMKLSISMQWYEPSVRRSIGYLIYCDADSQNITDVNTQSYKYQIEPDPAEVDRKNKQDKKNEEIANTKIFELEELDKPISKFGNNIQLIIESQIKDIYKSKEKNLEEMVFAGYLLVQIKGDGNIKEISILPDEISNNSISDIKLIKTNWRYSPLTYKGFLINSAEEKVDVNYHYIVRKINFRLKNGTLYFADGVGRGNEVGYKKEKLEKIKKAIGEKKGSYKITFIEHKFYDDDYIEIVD